MVDIFLTEASIYGRISKIHVLPFVDVRSGADLSANDTFHAIHCALRPLPAKPGLVVIPPSDIINQKFLLRSKAIRMHSDKQILPLFVPRLVFLFECYRRYFFRLQIFFKLHFINSISYTL